MKKNLQLISITFLSPSYPLLLLSPSIPPPFEAPGFTPSFPNPYLNLPALKIRWLSYFVWYIKLSLLQTIPFRQNIIFKEITVNLDLNLHCCRLLKFIRTFNLIKKPQQVFYSLLERVLIRSLRCSTIIDDALDGA